MSETTKLALSVEEFAKAYGIGRTMVFSEIKAGRLQVIHIGRLTRITCAEAEDYGRRLEGKGAE